MAEARLGVHPMPGLQRAGFEVDTNVKVCQAYVGKAGLVVYVPHPRYWLRGARRWFGRALNKTRVAFLPVSLHLTAVVATGVTAGVLKAAPTSWLRSGSLAELLWHTDSFNPLSKHLPVWFRVGYLAAGASVTGLLLVAATQRFVLRRLLSYHGWLDRANHNTLKTKLWGVLMKKLYLNRISDQLYAYQWCLPKQPLPNVKETVRRYLETVEPLMTPEEFAQHREQATKFVVEESGALQRPLWFKHALYKNYVSNWWLDLVYLRSREPLPINSNWYGITFAHYQPTTSQAARAAANTFAFVRLCRQLETETLEPQVLAGVAPLCMGQYSYAFCTTRAPGHEQDVLDKYDFHESRHVVVLHKGRIFKLPVYSPNTMQALSPLQLYHAFEGILESVDEATEIERLLPALTTGNRSEWAQLREQYFLSDRHNQTRLVALESAMFVVCLDEEEPDSWTDQGRLLMCGNGHSRWCDKSFNLVITKNAKAGVHAEHSWGDAPALAHLIEMVMLTDRNREFYNEDGSIKHLPSDEAKLKAGKLQTYPAMRIDFRFDGMKALLERVRHFDADFRLRIANFDLCVECFDEFGKKFIGKSAKASPDAFIQMALQLAYFRDQGRFDLTYESATLRLFRLGRTETIRSLSHESCAFVRAFEAQTHSREALQKMLRAACERHQRYTMDAMRGNGVDRHLFAMYVVSVGTNRPSDFLKAALGRKWTLSTSQVPPQQCPDRFYQDSPFKGEYFSPNGGFGPVADNGYGVCYSVWNGRLYFNVSSSVAAANTDATRFNARIRQALHDLGQLFSEPA